VTPLILLALLAAIGIIAGVSLRLVMTRRKSNIVGVEPGTAKGVPDSVKREVAEHRAKLIKELEAREGGEAGGDPDVDAEADLDISIDEGLRLAVEDAMAGVAADVEDLEPLPAPLIEAPVKPRFRDRLTKARSKLAGMVGALTGRSKIDEEAWDEIEEALIGADVGLDATQELLSHLRTQVTEQGLETGDQLLDALKAELKLRLTGPDLSLAYADSKPTVWLFVGVNGVGKTTTIGKLGKREINDGKKVVMAAGDTFRAAAAEQLGMWAERCGADLVRGNEGGDPSAVIFDAIESASAKGADLVLADTAGRLHTKLNLMEELKKVRRVAEKGAGTVSEVLLVLDATTGQNGLVQAKQFTEAADLTGVVLTKLDGSAKGGIVFAIQSTLGIPVKLVGLGEGADDLVPFDADEFVDALFS